MTHYTVLLELNDRRELVPHIPSAKASCQSDYRDNSGQVPSPKVCLTANSPVNRSSAKRAQRKAGLRTRKRMERRVCLRERANEKGAVSRNLLDP
jgi:hypothetical protein